MTTVISIENLSKVYRLGQIGTGTFSRDLELWFARLRGKPNPFLKIGQQDHGNQVGEDLWALRDVSFTVDQGEVLGIIGRNGAGKSTLLKILSRVTAPTSGRIKVKGRVASLLEVGTGFHPELTGRENVYLNGAILGMTRLEVDRKFDEIVAFAEVEKFIDTPVKRYSSGMYVRLAFAVAAHLEPEILVVDEVLAVGDIEFQKKCIGKMGEVAKGGRTVLFVSHNMGAITRLCSRSILLVQGNLVFDGYSEDTIKHYMNSLMQYSERIATFNSVPGKPINITRVSIHAEGKGLTETLDIRDKIWVEIDYQVHHEISSVNLSFALKKDGIVLFHSWDTDTAQELLKKRYPGRYTARLSLPQGMFTRGSYTINIGAGQPNVGAIVQQNDCLAFDLDDNLSDPKRVSYSRGGFLILPIIWETTISQVELNK